MKLLLFGKNGQLGRELQRTLLPFGSVTILGRSDTDLAKPEQIQQALKTYQPDIIINPAAYTAVEAAESNPEAAYAVNEQAPKIMAQWASDNKALLVHYSTDYVFDGAKPTPYTESDATAPLNVYGQSKLAGEQAILNSGCQALIFRTSWVVSAYGNNFIRTILNLAAQRDQLSVVDDQIGAPTSAELLADVSALAIAAYRQNHLDSGLYHLTAAGETSWHELACRVVDALQQHKANAPLKSAKIKAVPTSEYPTTAKRPLNSRLDCGRLEQSLGLSLPDWTVHIDRILTELLN